MKPITRRSFVTAATGAAAALTVGRLGVLAQSATPQAAPEAISPLVNYPTLTVTIGAAGFTLSAPTVPAGKVRLVVANTSKNQTGAVVLGPGSGQSMADLQTAVSTPVPAQGFPPFLYKAVILGGPQDLAPGDTKAALLDIPAGDWLVFNDGSLPSVPFKAAASSESKTDEPAAAAEVTLSDFSFSGLDSIKTGPQLWKVTNKGAQPHMLVLANVPAGTTPTQVDATLKAQSTGTPVSGALSSDQLQFLNDGVLLLSPGKTMWLPIGLPTGAYLALCFVTDPTNGKAHAMEGMTKLFTIG